MKDFKTTVLICAPSYAANLASWLQEQHLHAESLNLRVGLFGAEPWSESLRLQLEESFHIRALDNYGLTEIIGPGVAGECGARNGLHINEDHFIVEVIDPKSLEPLPAGEQGELVFTTITKEGFPLIRYRTGDLSELLEGPCSCGRSLRRMGRVSGRTDDLIFFKGAKIFPSQIEEILLETEGAAPHYRIVLDRQDGNETMEIQVEMLESFPAFDELKNLERLRDSVARSIEQRLGVQAKVTLVEPRSLLRESGGKIRRVLDRRRG
jgi:phenylacetate-CoA ligase